MAITIFWHMLENLPWNLHTALTSPQLFLRNIYPCQTTKGNLKNHVNRVHLKVKPLKKIPCTYCEKSFEDAQPLEYHINLIHLKIKPYKCDFCNMCFALRSIAKSHINQIHLNLKKKKQ